MRGAVDLPDDQPRLHRLSEPDVIGDEHARMRVAKHRQRRLELIRHQRNPFRTASQSAMGMRCAKGVADLSRPTLPRHDLEPGTRGGAGPVEGNEQCANCRQRDVREIDRLTVAEGVRSGDVPGGAANEEAISRSPGHVERVGGKTGAGAPCADRSSVCRGRAGGRAWGCAVLARLWGWARGRNCHRANGAGPVQRGADRTSSSARRDTMTVCCPPRLPVAPLPGTRTRRIRQPRA